MTAACIGVPVHHEGTTGTKASLQQNGSLDPDNIKLLVVAPLTDAFRYPSRLRALRVFVVKTAGGAGPAQWYRPIGDASVPSVPSVPLG